MICRLSRGTEYFFESRCKGVQEDIFFGKRSRVMYIKLSATFGLSHIYPVGCFVAGTMEAVRFYKCFQKDRFIAVESSPILWDTFGDHSKEFGCEVF